MPPRQLTLLVLAYQYHVLASKALRAATDLKTAVQICDEVHKHASNIEMHDQLETLMHSAEQMEREATLIEQELGLRSCIKT